MKTNTDVVLKDRHRQILAGIGVKKELLEKIYKKYPEINVKRTVEAFLLKLLEID